MWRPARDALGVCFIVFPGLLFGLAASDENANATAILEMRRDLDEIIRSIERELNFSDIEGATAANMSLLALESAEVMDSELIDSNVTSLAHKGLEPHPWAGLSHVVENRHVDEGLDDEDDLDDDLEYDDHDTDLDGDNFDQAHLASSNLSQHDALLQDSDDDEIDDDADADVDDDAGSDVDDDADADDYDDVNDDLGDVNVDDLEPPKALFTFDVKDYDDTDTSLEELDSREEDDDVDDGLPCDGQAGTLNSTLATE
eukprot:TRINITY_DN5713_c0_g1_i1.p1 TRINITY_DN5713_c0_g1~~TRINITY_DN5713_c0_g1_i1.p1  ORF type:complete len:258 (-),score=76.90 TRINITY_DN5713_c0_g1_i1:688-1461(-)